MESIQLSSLLKKVEEVVIRIGEFQKEHWNHVAQNEIQLKSSNQLVSFVDQQSEQMLVDGLTELVEGSTVIGEESAAENRVLTEYTWIIDPLDGTTNFLHGLPVFSISVALFHQNDPVLAVVHCPVLKETFTSYLNGGAYLNGSPIHVSSNNHLNNCLIATGFPYHEFGRMDGYVETLKTFMTDTQGLRRMGSAAIDLAYTACGRFDAFFEMDLSPWDIAAGILLVREAGGMVTDFSGNTELVFGNEIIAASSLIYSDFTQIIRNNLG
jgi:myo-inositol-1(or 4)-monophosphatase